MVYSTYTKQRILYLRDQGYKAPTITKLLREERIKCTRVGVVYFLKKFAKTGNLNRRAVSGWPSKIKELVEQQMRLDDETTATQLHQFLTSKGYSISLRTILRCRMALGWTFRGSAYCQHIHEENKVKRLEWAWNHQGYDFAEAIWTDECTVKMESHRCFACRKRGEAPRHKPR